MESKAKGHKSFFSSAKNGLSNIFNRRNKVIDLAVALRAKELSDIEKRIHSLYNNRPKRSHLRLTSRPNPEYIWHEKKLKYLKDALKELDKCDGLDKKLEKARKKIIKQLEKKENKRRVQLGKDAKEQKAIPSNIEEDQVDEINYKAIELPLKILGTKKLEWEIREINKWKVELKKLFNTTHTITKLREVGEAALAEHDNEKGYGTYLTEMRDIIAQQKLTFFLDDPSGETATDTLLNLARITLSFPQTLKKEMKQLLLDQLAVKKQEEDRKVTVFKDLIDEIVNEKKKEDISILHIVSCLAKVEAWQEKYGIHHDEYYNNNGTYKEKHDLWETINKEEITPETIFNLKESVFQELKNLAENNKYKTYDDWKKYQTLWTEIKPLKSITEEEKVAFKEAETTFKEVEAVSMNIESVLTNKTWVQGTGQWKIDVDWTEGGNFPSIGTTLASEWLSRASSDTFGKAITKQLLDKQTELVDSVVKPGAKEFPTFRENWQTYKTNAEKIVKLKENETKIKETIQTIKNIPSILQGALLDFMIAMNDVWEKITELLAFLEKAPNEIKNLLDALLKKLGLVWSRLKELLAQVKDLPAGIATIINTAIKAVKGLYRELKTLAEELADNMKEAPEILKGYFDTFKNALNQFLQDFKVALIKVLNDAKKFYTNISEIIKNTIDDIISAAETFINQLDFNIKLPKPSIPKLSFGDLLNMGDLEKGLEGARDALYTAIEKVTNHPCYQLDKAYEDWENEMTKEANKTIEEGEKKMANWDTALGEFESKYGNILSYYREVYPLLEMTLEKSQPSTGKWEALKVFLDSLGKRLQNIEQWRTETEKAIKDRDELDIINDELNILSTDIDNVFDSYTRTNRSIVNHKDWDIELIIDSEKEVKLIIERSAIIEESWKDIRNTKDKIISKVADNLPKTADLLNTWNKKIVEIPNTTSTKMMLYIIGKDKCTSKDLSNTAKKLRDEFKIRIEAIETNITQNIPAYGLKVPKETPPPIKAEEDLMWEYYYTLQSQVEKSKELYLRCREVRHNIKGKQPTERSNFVTFDTNTTEALESLKARIEDYEADVAKSHAAAEKRLEERKKSTQEKVDAAYSYMKSWKDDKLPGGVSVAELKTKYNVAKKSIKDFKNDFNRKNWSIFEPTQISENITFLKDKLLAILNKLGLSDLIEAAQGFKKAYDQKKKVLGTISILKEKAIEAEDDETSAMYTWMWRKKARQVIERVMNAMLKAINGICRVIEIATGGLAAAFTGIVRIITRVLNLGKKAAKGVKAIYKELKGTRGRNRKEYAKEIVEGYLGNKKAEMKTLIEVLDPKALPLAVKELSNEPSNGTITSLLITDVKAAVRKKIERELGSVVSRLDKEATETLQAKLDQALASDAAKITTEVAGVIKWIQGEGKTSNLDKEDEEALKLLEEELEADETGEEAVAEHGEDTEGAPNEASDGEFMTEYQKSDNDKKEAAEAFLIDRIAKALKSTI